MPDSQLKRLVFTWTPHPDGMQKTLLVLSAIDLFFFSYYLLNFEMTRESTISDTLFTDTGYKVVLSVFLSLRLLGGALFLYRFRFKHWLWECLGYIGIIAALGGWGYLVYHKDNFHHFIGVGFFCTGSFAYSLAFLRLAAISRDDREFLHVIMELILLMGVVLLVIAFVGLWFEEEKRGWHSDPSGKGQLTAYVIEHAAYMGHLLFYALFFLYHSPDWGKSVDGATVGEAYYDYQDRHEARDGTPMVCHPLIYKDRLPTVTETLS